MKRPNTQKFKPPPFVVDENSTRLSTSTSSFPTGSSVTSVKDFDLDNKGTPDPLVVSQLTERLGTRWVFVTADKQRNLKDEANVAGVTTIIFSRNNSGTVVQGQLLKRLWQTPGFRNYERITDEYTEIKLSKDSVTYQKRSGKQGVKKLSKPFKHGISDDILPIRKGDL